MTSSDDDEQFSAVLRAVAASPTIPLRPDGVLGGRFLLRRILGEGAFGLVYEAEDRKHGRRVALKLLRRAQQGWLYRFKREFRVLHEMAHPNLVALDELFFLEDHWFFTMEMLDATHFPGRTDGLTILRSRLRQVFEGLAFLHAANITHRDIKPSNVLVTREGRVVLVDFGLVTEESSEDTSVASAVVGTPVYMAPEQAAARKVGSPADVYAVGVMLYELLTGLTPIKGSPLQILAEKQTREPPPPIAVAPSVPEDLNELCVQLLRLDPALRPSAADAARSLGPVLSSTINATGGGSRQRRNRLFGRQGELDRLCSAFDASTAGKLVTVLVHGESGIGKSCLVRHFTAQLLEHCSEIILLEGRCYEREAVPYKTLDGIVDALSHRLSRWPASDVATVLPTQFGELAQIFPVLLRVPQIAKEYQRLANMVDPYELRQRGFDQLRDLFCRLARHRTTVITIDDLQWADEDGLRALAELLRQPNAPSLMLVGMLRASPEQALGPLRATLPSDAIEIQLAPLPDSEATALAEDMLQSRDAAHISLQQIVAEARGHPLFIEELSRHAVSSTASSDSLKLDDAIRGRIAQLEQTAQQIVELVAVAGKPLPRYVAAMAVKLDVIELKRIVGSLRAANLIRPTSIRDVPAIEAYHDRVREAVLARVEMTRLCRLHRTLALSFEASSHSDPETLAIHWRGAKDAELAVKYATEAGNQAAQAFAFDRAARWYDEALELLPSDNANRPALHIQLGEALAFAGRGGIAAKHFELAAVTSSPLVALDLRRRASQALLLSGRIDEGITTIRTALSSLGVGIPKTPAKALVSLLLRRAVLRLRGLRFSERPACDVSPRMLGRIDYCESLASAFSYVDPLLGSDLHTRQVLLALRAGEPGRVSRALAGEAVYSASIGLLHRAERCLLLSQDIANRVNEPSVSGRVSLCRGMVSALLGRWLEAFHHMEDANRILGVGVPGVAWELDVIRDFEMELLGWMGRLEELTRGVTAGIHDAEDRGDLFFANSMRIGLSNLIWLKSDEVDHAWSETERAAREWSHGGFHIQHFWNLYAKVQIELYRGAFRAAHVRLHSQWGQLRRSLLLRVQYFRIIMLELRARTTLAAACDLSRTSPGDSRALIAAVERCIHKLMHERVCWAQAFGRLLQAGVENVRGNRERTVQLLSTAVEALHSADMTLFATAAEQRLAPLIGGITGTALTARATSWLASQSVAVPHRFITMLTPAFAVSP
jgi:hypothetical protein